MTIACKCPACTPTPAPTYTEAWRHETECRHVARLPDKSTRKRYLALVAKVRGESAMRRIISGLRQIHDRVAA